jgi:hypothetical protein
MHNLSSFIARKHLLGAKFTARFCAWPRSPGDLSAFYCNYILLDLKERL